MSGRILRAFAIVTVLAPLWLAAAGPASAVGPGTFTKVTTPSGNLIYHFNGNLGATNNLIVSGQTSTDVTTVDVDCVYLSQGTVNARTLAAGVPVTGGSFSVTANLSMVPNNCRIRAIPSGVDPTNDYLGSYAGPILYTNELAPDTRGSTKVGYLAVGEQGSGIGIVEDAATCGVFLLATIMPPSMTVVGPGSPLCSFSLPGTNLTSTGTPTASTIVVDGHSTYLPAAVANFLISGQSLTVTQTALTTTFTRRSSGDITVTESAPLVRCSVDDTYPPTAASCPALVNTGVTFARRVDLFRGAHQVRFRDNFSSTNGHRHTVATQYLSTLPTLDTGKTGYRIPGHGSAFVTPTPDQVVTGLGARAGTVLARSDIHAVEGDPQADTLGLSWSRAPSKLQFSHTDVNSFAMPYSMTVPAGGKSYVGFAVSEANTTSAASSLAAKATREVVVAPTMTSPKPGAVIHGHLTTVKGSVSLGANGLPTSVKVNGHAAKLTKVSATKDTYAVTFRETFGRHKLTVVARDLAGNTASISRRVTNKA
jgi:hypothetical protein